MCWSVSLSLIGSGLQYDGVTKTLVELFQTMTSASGEHGAVSTWTLRLALAAERRSAFAVGKY